MYTPRVLQGYYQLGSSGRGEQAGPGGGQVEATGPGPEVQRLRHPLHAQLEDYQHHQLYYIVLCASEQTC